ncbi:MAG TPA: efflux RND transporter periplasmic adaptor subunit [Rhodanobacteraceae bacterium]
MPRFKPRWKIIVIVIVVIIILLLGWRAMHGAGGPQRGAFGRHAGGQQAPVPVTVVPVKQENVPIYLTSNGTVQALRTVTVQPQVGGRLLSINFKEGAEVTKGQVLAEIDPSTYQATYDQAMARVRSDAAQLATARSNLVRDQQLIKQNYVSQQDVNTQANTVKQLEATVAADKASAESARINLGYTKIRAPITGLTGIRQVDPGNVLTTGSAIVTLTHVHPINVIFTLPAQDMDQVRAAQAKAPLPVVVNQKNGDQHVLADDGVLTVINNQIDPDTGTFTLKSQFPNKQDELWPGQYVNVRMQVSTVDNGLVIPTQAVQRGPDGDYVYLLDAKAKTVSMQAVTISGEVGDTEEMVGSGLKAGDMIVTEGQFRLKPGSKVIPLKPGEVPVPAARTPVNGKAGKAGRAKWSGHHKDAAPATK